MSTTPQTEQPHCLNCGAPLSGPWCHACGQPVKGMVRHFKSIIGDVLDTLFEYDNRIWRTLVPLYFRPGAITVDFLAGRRMRYVLPFRLFFVLSVVAFLSLQMTAVPQFGEGEGGWFQTRSEFDELTTVEAVVAARDAALAGMEEGAREMESTGVPGMVAGAAGMRAGMTAIREAAARRIAEIEGSGKGAAGLEVEVEVDATAPTPAPTRKGLRIMIDSEEWDPETNPLVFESMPDFVNERINHWIGRAVENLERADKDPGRLIEAMLGLLPAVLFVLMPIFALLLKVFYLFKRRLYMEHLVVALHSHSFLCQAILVGLLLVWLAGLSADVAVLGTALSWLTMLSFIWVPVYLLLMQRRVYRQNWFLTLFKFGVIGIVYTVMISLAVVAAALISLINL